MAELAGEADSPDREMHSPNPNKIQFTDQVQDPASASHSLQEQQPSALVDDNDSEETLERQTLEGQSKDVQEAAEPTLHASSENPSCDNESESVVAQVTYAPSPPAEKVFDTTPVLNSKLNAKAPEFIPRAAQAQTTVFAEGHYPLELNDVIAEGHKDTSSKKIVLTEELRQKIVSQVEFYLGDANLPNDKHLLKYVKKDPDGFVPITAIASFRKMKNLVNNTSLISAALLTSSQLVVSEDGKKVRRLHPLPEIDVAEVQSRTVVAENLPENHSIENLEKLFGSVGKVKLVRVLPPQAYDTRHTAAKHQKTSMIVSNKLHALVEYESVEQAEKAVAELNDEGNWRSGLHVRMLSKRMGKYGHQSKTSKQVDASEVHHVEEDDSPNAVADEHEGDGHHVNDKTGARKGRGRGHGKTRPRGQHHQHGNGRGHTSLSVAPGASSGEGASKQPPGPRMPDGTRGFTMGRGRPVVDSISKSEIP
eukprot:TRINITY_DN37761_c0_g1_i1.p1 TRINITY_DN37761_c0_g1~~TRINITY_DN37761_c0_g1_i1.p1  ORF type:complete len:479 (+),score=130.17 TRINITY_DN37761_c0_g1_i1:149-1585(+)